MKRPKRFQLQRRIRCGSGKVRLVLAESATIEGIMRHKRLYGCGRVVEVRRGSAIS